MDAKELTDLLVMDQRYPQGFDPYRDIDKVTIDFRKLLSLVNKIQQEAYEKAARVAYEFHQEWIDDDSDYSAGIINASGKISFLIRALKEK